MEGGREGGGVKAHFGETRGIYRLVACFLMRYHCELNENAGHSLHSKQHSHLKNKRAL
jgi:hypothetical protein